MREQRGLSVVRERQFVGWTLETQLAEWRAERRVGALEHVTRFGERSNRNRHPFASLAREEEDDVHGQRRTTIEPQVKPAPKATSNTVEPSPRIPFSIASSSAIGTEAADVFPNRSTFT